MTMVLVVAAASLSLAPYPVTSFDSVHSTWTSSDAWLLDRRGEPLSRVRIDHDRRRGDWTALGDISPALTEAALASEDRRFHEHAGVDWLALGAALRQTAAREHRGGSTITMQLAAHLHPELELSGRRGIIEKWRQIRQALAIERRWSKQQILEAWLNLTPFRGELEGVDAASRVLFGKRPGGLDRVESALLASLVRAPNAAASRVAKRACALLNGVERDCLLAQGLAAAGLRPRAMRDDLEGAAPHLAQRLLKHPGERLKSTLDARVQRFALESLTRHLRELEGRGVEDGALVVLDNATGEPLAWVGSSGGLSRAQAVDGVVAPRQPGSALKPFLYALAIERRLLTAASILDDSPLAVTLPTGLYVPQNYDHSFRGQVSLRQALASSLNVPAVRTLALTGYDAFYEKLKRLGFSTLTRDADHYGYALALGSAEVTLIDLANAYRTLANGGGEAIDPRAAYIVSDILADSAARALTFGLASPLATRYRASVKTGTSKEMRDNWAVGFTTRYTVGAWVGNFSGAPMRNVSGVDGAAPVWREVVDFLHEDGLPEAPRAPDGVVRQRIDYAGALEPARDEWFIAGTERAKIVAIPGQAPRAYIEAPSNGAIYAIDPDIPRDRQRLIVKTRGAPKGARLVLMDGREARADRPVMWLPAPGKREIVLKARDGKELDRVSFEVRGIGPRR